MKTNISKLSPYSEEYFTECLQVYNSRNKLFQMSADGTMVLPNGENAIEQNNLKLRYEKEIFTRLDGYLYKDMREWKNFPILSEKGVGVWMSITPLEIASHYNPIRLAKGVVGTAGLGLGYFVQMIIDKPEVDKIIVFEINEDVINLYKKCFGENEKVVILNKDVRDLDNWGDYNFDFFYADIYPDLGSEDVVEDYINFMSTNKVKKYWYWGLELDVIADEDANFPKDWIEDTQKLMYDFRVSDHWKMRNWYPSSAWDEVDFKNIGKRTQKASLGIENPLCEE